MLQDGAYLRHARLFRGEERLQSFQRFLRVHFQRREHKPFLAPEPGVQARRVDARFLHNGADGRRRIAALPKTVNDFMQKRIVIVGWRSSHYILLYTESPKNA